MQCFGYKFSHFSRLYNFVVRFDSQIYWLKRLFFDIAYRRRRRQHWFLWCEILFNLRLNSFVVVRSCVVHVVQWNLTFLNLTPLSLYLSANYTNNKVWYQREKFQFVLYILLLLSRSERQNPFAMFSIHHLVVVRSTFIIILFIYRSVGWMFTLSYTPTRFSTFISIKYDP